MDKNKGLFWNNLLKNPKNTGNKWNNCYIILIKK